MKHLVTSWILILFLSLNSMITIAQSSFETHTIDPDFEGAASVFAADINGDGHMDVMSAAPYAGAIAWYESDGNNPPQFTKYIVDDTFVNGLYVYADTINGDTLPDILGASWDGHEIALWMQDGNNPVGWNKQIIDDSFAGAHEVKSANIDGDAHMDIIGAGAENHQIAWWHNDGGDPIVWTKHVISSTALGARSVFPVDIDFDGDTDILAAAFTSDDILLFVNEGGSPVQFAEVTIDGSFNGAHWVHAQDMDNDGDIDVLAAGYMCADIAIWYNDGQLPATWTKYTVENYFPGALSVVTGDFDNNGFMDVVGAGDQAGEVVCWYQKDTTGIVFTKEIVDGTLWGAWPVFACDLDADDDLDILASSSTIDEVRWYENTGPITTVTPLISPDEMEIKLTPNPVKESLNIHYSLNSQAEVSVQIVSSQGTIIQTLCREIQESGSYQLSWNRRSLSGVNCSGGTYFCQITINGISYQKPFILLN